jgi:hypothetical protein
MKFVSKNGFRVIDFDGFFGKGGSMVFEWGLPKNMASVGRQIDLDIR